MKEYTLKRRYITGAPMQSDRTFGTVKLSNGQKIKTLELPYLQNKVGVSCIPEGRYLVKRDTHGKHTWFKIMDVPGRTFIEWHIGHKPEHSQGCILSDIIDLQDLLLDTNAENFWLNIVKE